MTQNEPEVPKGYANDLDRIMDLDPLELTEQDLDTIIAYQRKRRSDFDSGIKLKKEKGPMQSVDLVAKLGLGPKPAEIKRRF